MKILSYNFIKKFKGKIINIHPFYCQNIRFKYTLQGLANNDFTGCTVHFVNNKLDSGKIILQKKIKVLRNDSIKKLSKRVLNEEHKIYPKAIIKLFS